MRMKGVRSSAGVTVAAASKINAAMNLRNNSPQR
jgi:hypothetical protein